VVLSVTPFHLVRDDRAVVDGGDGADHPARLDSKFGTAIPTRRFLFVPFHRDELRPVTDLLTDAPAGAAVTSVLICDDRPTARRALAALLTPPLPEGGIVGAVSDGLALLDAFAVHPADLVLVGVRRGELIGPAAVDLLLGSNPSASVIVYGKLSGPDQPGSGV